MTTTLTSSIVIAAPRSQVWVALADIGNVSRLSPGILRSELTSGQQTGVGTTRHCDLAMMGASVEERVTRWEAASALDIEIFEWTKLPMVRAMEARFRLEDAGGGTRLEAALSYRVGMGPIGGLMNALMMRRTMAKGWAAFMAGIRHHVETGEAVQPDTALDLTAVAAA